MRDIQPPFYIQRKNTLNLMYLKNMRDDSIFEIYFQIFQIDQKLLEEKEKLTSKIEEVFFIKQDGKLLNLKRKIYNSKRLNENDVKTLSAYKDLLDKYSNFMDALQQKDELIDILRQKLNESILRSREELKCAFAEESYLLNATKLIDSHLIEYIGKYKEFDFSTLNSKQRKKELSLLKIFLKASMKTSPFSTFTNSIFHLTTPKKDTIGKNNIFAELNVTVILQIYSVVKKRAHYRLKMPYELNPSLDKIGSSYAYTSLIDGDFHKVFQTESVQYKIKQNRLLNYLYDNKKGKYFDYAALQKIFPELSEEIYFKLIDSTIVVPAKNIELSKIGSLAKFLNFIKDWELDNDVFINKIYNILQYVDGLLRRYNITDIEDWYSKYQTLKLIHSNISVIYELAGIGEISIRDVLYEDFVSLGTCSINDSYRYREEIDCLIKLSVLFDVNFKFQNYFGKLFHEKFGDNFIATNEKSVIELIVRNNRKFDFLWQNEWSCENLSDDSELNIRLNNLKEKFINILDNSKDGKLSSREIQQIFDNNLDYFPNIRSLDLFYQDVEGGQIVINDIYKGYLTYFSRFIDYVFPESFEEFNKYKKILFNNSKETVAEIMEFHGFNSNIHSSLASTRFTTKGSYDYENLYGAEQRINFGELYYKYDEKTKKVKLTDQNKDFSVMFLGNLVPSSLSGIFGLLNSLFSSFKLDFPIHRYVFLKNHGKNIIKIPRYSIGDVIVQRKGWIVKREIFMELFTDDWVKTSYFIWKFFNENGIPEQHFIQGYFGKEYSEFEASTKYKKLKPMYIDMRNPLILFHLSSLIPETEYILFEEALPDVEPTKDYTCEKLIEETRIF